MPTPSPAIRHADAADASPDTMWDFNLADHWEMDQEHKRGVFNFRPHQKN